MKSLIAGGLALVISVTWGCGSSEEPSQRSTTEPVAEPTNNTDGRTTADASAANDAATSRGTGGGSADDDAGSSEGTSPGAPGTCAPDAVCGGLDKCIDYCYGARCCTLNCECSGDEADPNAHLKCSLTCTR
jgi:hypothetical protein